MLCLHKAFSPCSHGKKESTGVSSFSYKGRFLSDMDVTLTISLATFLKAPYPSKVTLEFRVII